MIYRITPQKTDTLIKLLFKNMAYFYFNISLGSDIYPILISVKHL